MGLLRPLGEDVSVWVDAPPAQVWALVTDVTRIGEFSPETFEAQWTRGSTGPEVGAHFKGHVKRNGVGPTYWSACRVTRCEPDRSFEFSVGTGKTTFTNWGYRLMAQAGGTLVSEYYRLEPAWHTSVYWAVLGRLRRRTNRKGMQKTLERMKAALERPTAGASEHRASDGNNRE